MRDRIRAAIDHALTRWDNLLTMLELGEENGDD